MTHHSGATSALDSLKLRPLTERDAHFILDWREHPIVGQFLDPHFRAPEVVRSWILETLSTEPWTVRGITYNDRLIGYCSITDLDTKIGKAQVGIVIGEPGLWGRGFGKHVLGILLPHCFRQHNLHRVLAIIARGNERSIHLFESIGFVHEGTLREATLVDGARTDLLCYSMLAPEYSGNRTVNETKR